MNSMRPSEQAAQTVLSKREREEREPGLLKKGIKTAVGLGTTAAGLGIGSKILPFLSEYIPADLAIKGISKISPDLGNFLKSGMKKGLDPQEGLNFVKDKISKSEQQQAEKPKEQRNIIEQYSPELHEFIKEQVTKGRPHLEAGALAQLQDKYKKVIKKIEEDHKTPFSAILDTIYGGGQYGGAVNPPQQNQPQQQMQQPGQGQQGISDEEILKLIGNALKL